MQTLLSEIAFLLGEESQEAGEQIIFLSSGSFRASNLPEKDYASWKVLMYLIRYIPFLSDEFFKINKGT